MATPRKPTSVHMEDGHRCCPHIRRVGSILLALVTPLGAVHVESATLSPDAVAKVDKLVRDRLVGSDAPTPGFAIAILAAGGHMVSNSCGL
jgi:hypothetical protein